MTTYWVDSLEVEHLWGEKDLRLNFDHDVNIVIGPNASGKTTLLKLLHSLFAGDFIGLKEIEFDRVTVRLRGFDEPSRRTIKVQTIEEGFLCNISGRKYTVDLESASLRYGSSARRYELYSRYLLRPHASDQSQEASEALRKLVPTVWLPVSRRLPISTEEYAGPSEFDRRARLDSVDERLKELMDDLIKYRLGLDAQLSERYKEFERQALGVMLYNEQYDRMGSLSMGSPPTDDEKKLLLQAFEEAGLLDQKMRQRINRHFSAAEDALRRLSQDFSGDESPDFDAFFVIPLIPRTRDMIDVARRLDDQREDIFSALHDYEEIVSSFLKGKLIEVLDSGELQILSSETPSGQRRHLSPDRLSSGEKQIVILLTQALLKQEQPVVYLADEPELSLHVTWQEKLLDSLLTLGGRTQIIIATHSPDIVGKYTKNVINLGRLD